MNTERLACPCGCGLSLTTRALKALEYIAGVVLEKTGAPIVVSSGARCAQHNASRGFSKNSAHTLGEAFDIITPNSTVRYWVVRAAVEYGLIRMGYSGGAKIHPQSRFVHADCCNSSDKLPDGTGFYPAHVMFDY